MQVEATAPDWYLENLQIKAANERILREIDCRLAECKELIDATETTLNSWSPQAKQSYPGLYTLDCLLINIAEQKKVSLSLEISSLLVRYREVESQRLESLSQLMRHHKIGRIPESWH